jgi:post-segregation antitoxin (ccd killing protein)
MDSMDKITSHRKHGQLNVRVSRELTERVRNAAYWNPRLTVSGITERGLQLALAEIERDGGPYPQRESKLRGGSSVK